MPSQGRTSHGKNSDLIEAQRWGFWVGTRRAPRRAVRWETTRLEDGRETRRGRNWVEILPHGSTREPERFFASDVEYVGPAEWLTYYPAVDEPICGWGRARPEGGMQYCPRSCRETDDGEREAFCPAHMRELSAPEGEEQHDAGEAQRPDAQ